MSPCLVVLFLLLQIVCSSRSLGLTPPVASNSDINRQQLLQQQNKFLPDGISRVDKLRVFLECRKECITKCDRLVYVYSTKKEFCHDCIRQCMLAVLQQAKSLGIDFSSPQEERMQGDAPALPVDAAEKARRRERRRQMRRNRRKEGRGGGKKRERQLLKNCIVH